MKPWNITSNDGRFEAIFTPILNRQSLTDAKIIVSEQNQIFGTMNGIAILDDETRIEMKDFPCALEKVRNKY